MTVRPLPAILLAVSLFLPGCGGGGGGSPAGSGDLATPPIGTQPAPVPGDALSPLQAAWEASAREGLSSMNSSASGLWLFFTTRSLNVSPSATGTAPYTLHEASTIVGSLPAPAEFMQCGRSTGRHWYEFMLNARGEIALRCGRSPIRVVYAGPGIEHIQADEANVPVMKYRITAFETSDLAGLNIAEYMRANFPSMRSTQSNPAVFPAGARAAFISSARSEVAFVLLPAGYGLPPEPVVPYWGSKPATKIEETESAATLAAGAFYTVGGRRVWIGASNGAYAEVDGFVYYGVGLLPQTESLRSSPSFNPVARDAIRAADLKL
jgi:hypothetical protein